MDSKELKNKIIQNIENKADDIINFAEHLFLHAESGFREFETAKIVSDKLKEFGYDCLVLDDIPGVKMTIDTGKPGPSVAILAELDAIICPLHPHSNKDTGAVHACGHNAQLSAMLGAAFGLIDENVLSQLSGKIHFIAVPAEELIELSYREELCEKGLIKYMAGKPEFLYRGLFDDVDMCLTVHSTNMEKKAGLSKSFNGCVLKRVEYKGKASHGANPSNGINALYAANIGLSAINALRETFHERDQIRVHPIITKGGDIVNVIPDDVRIETFVRANTIEGIDKANKKVDRAFVAGALAMGAEIKVTDYPGYSPLYTDVNLTNLSREVLFELFGDDILEEASHSNGSTDLGDLSLLMPVSLTWTSGVKGGLHSADYTVADPYTTYVTGAKVFALMTVELLANGAEKATEILHDFTPIFKNKEEYFKYIDDISSVKTFDDLFDSFKIDGPVNNKGDL